MIIPQGEAWERNMILNTLAKEIVLASTALSMNFSDFVTKIMERARNLYVYQKANRGTTCKYGHTRGGE